MRRARMTTAERKADTRRKIQLGGLILKAGLAFEEPAVADRPLPYRDCPEPAHTLLSRHLLR